MSRTILQFILLTFAINWAAAGLFYASGVGYSGLWMVAFGAFYMLVPGLVALWIDWRAGQDLRQSLGLKIQPNKWWLVAWLLPPLLAFLALGAALLLPGIGFDADMEGLLVAVEELLTDQQMEEARAELQRFPLWLLVPWQLVQALIAGATINAFFALGEELGWRGLMLRELASMGFWKSAGIIGVVWGLWHAPVVLQGHNYPEYPILGVAMMVGFCLLLSPLFSWVTLKCQSVLAAAIMHGTLNASAGFSILMLDDVVPLVVGIHGLVGFAVLAVANLLLFIVVRPEIGEMEWMTTSPPIPGHQGDDASG